MKNTTLGSEDVSMESPHKALGKLLAQKASEDALRDEEEGQCNLTSFQELQILLSSRDEVSSFWNFNIFGQILSHFQQMIIVLEKFHLR